MADPKPDEDVFRLKTPGVRDPPFVITGSIVNRLRASVQRTVAPPSLVGYIYVMYDNNLCSQPRAGMGIVAVCTPRGACLHHAFRLFEQYGCEVPVVDGDAQTCISHRCKGADAATVVQLLSQSDYAFQAVVIAVIDDVAYQQALDVLGQRNPPRVTIMVTLHRNPLIVADRLVRHGIRSGVLSTVFCIRAPTAMQSCCSPTRLRGHEF